MPQLNTLLYLSILLFAGLIFGRLAKLIKLPNVTGYIVAGLILGPSVLGVIPETTVESFDVISEMALAFIAFTIGCSFKLSYFKRVGATPIVIAIFEALIAVFLVQGVLILTGCELPFAIVLGAIAAATAPAATIMVIKQYRAKGPVTETLMSVVAIDDAVALIAFGFCVAIAKALKGEVSGDGGILMSILSPMLEVLLSLVIGCVCGFIMRLPLHFFKKSGNRTIIMIGSVFLASAAAEMLGGSSLLACMMTGAMLCNIYSESDSIAMLADNITPPLFLMFFVVSGAELQLAILPQIGVIGVVYVLVRVVGKLLGANLGARIMKTTREVRKYLGPTLIPQAGVAIGLTLVAQQVLPADEASRIRAIILCSTLIYEIVGPAITKISLTKAGEIEKQ